MRFSDKPLDSFGKSLGKNLITSYTKKAGTTSFDYLENSGTFVLEWDLPEGNPKEA